MRLIYLRTGRTVQDRTIARRFETVHMTTRLIRRKRKGRERLGLNLYVDDTPRFHADNRVY